LYWHAYRKRFELALNELEIFDTRKEIQESMLNVGIGSLSVAIAVVGGGPFLSGMTYMLNAVVSPLHGMLMGKQRRKLEEQARQSKPAALESS
jgi:hypothetical protein